MRRRRPVTVARWGADLLGFAFAALILAALVVNLGPALTIGLSGAFVSGGAGLVLHYIEDPAFFHRTIRLPNPFRRNASG